MNIRSLFPAAGLAAGFLPELLAGDVPVADSPAAASAAELPDARSSPRAADELDRIENERLARRVACAAGGFEYGLLGRSPTTVTVVASGGWLAVHLLEALSPLERRLAATDSAGGQRVREFHERLFDQSVDALLGHIRRRTGVELRGALAHVDLAGGSVVKTLTTGPFIDLFLMGRGLPALGVPVNAHLHANGTTAVAGIGAVRR